MQKRIGKNEVNNSMSIQVQDSFVHRITTEKKLLSQSSLLLSLVWSLSDSIIDSI